MLKGVSLTLQSGEVMAILGSKGSGKKALLDVIACRAENSTRGQVLLNGSTLTRSIFQQKCGYVTHSVDFIHGLTVSQTLHYTPTVVSFKSVLFVIRLEHLISTVCHPFTLVQWIFEKFKSSANPR